MRGQDQALEALFRPTVNAAGVELLGVERLGRPGGALLRVYIDRAQGVTLDDCERVSRQLSVLLDVEQPVRGDYVLEVSSPGLDRPLFSAEQMRGFVGERVRLELADPIDGRRRLSGRLLSVGEDGEALTVEIDGEPVELAWSTVERARLQPDEGPAGSRRRRRRRPA